MTAATLPEVRLGVPRDEQQALDVWAQVQLVQAGDKAAFDPIYRRYADTVFRFIYFRVGNRPLAEDLCSDTFVKALRGIGSFTWQGRDFGAFLVTIARNLVVDHFKSGRFRLEVPTSDVKTVETNDNRVYMQPEPAAAEYLTNRALMAGVTMLNAEQRQCIELRFLRGLSVAETAEAMGKNEGAIKALQYRAVGALRRMFPDPHDFGLPEPVRPYRDVSHAVEVPA